MKIKKSKNLSGFKHFSKNPLKSTKKKQKSNQKDPINVSSYLKLIKSIKLVKYLSSKNFGIPKIALMNCIEFIN